MKKILLAALISFTVTGAMAQTSKKTKKSKKPNKEAVANAKFAKLEEEKSLARKNQIASFYTEDSLRFQTDSLSYVQLEADRAAYKEARLRSVDSLNQLKYGYLNTERAEADKYARNSSQTLAGANLSEYQKVRVSTINQEYNAKAGSITADVQIAEAEKQKQLAALNEERLTKTRAAIGNSKTRKLEKERKEIIAKNGSDNTSAWITAAEGYAAIK